MLQISILVSILVSNLPLSTALPKLIVLDTGVGHRSNPVPRWQTALRALAPNGTNSTILRAFGDVPLPNNDVNPIGASSLSYSPSTFSLFLATGAGIIRTALDGSDPTIITVPGYDDTITAVTVAEQTKKLYYGTMTEGLIRRANLDGSDDEMFRNVSQGIELDFLPYMVQANSYPGGILVDEERGWVYWSAVRGDVYGSIRRVSLSSGNSTQEEEEVLLSGLSMPGQLRILDDEWLYWVEQGRWSTSPTAINRAKLPGSKVDGAAPLSTEVVVCSNQSDIFTGVDNTGVTVTLSISSFAFGGAGKTLWVVIQSAGRTMFGKMLETGIDGGELKVLTANTSDVGVPVGLEYVL